MRPDGSPSSAAWPVWPSAAPSCATWRRSGRSAGSSTPSRPSPVPRRCWPTYRATPTGSPSRTAGWSRFDEAGVTFRYKDYRRDGAERCRTMTLGTHEFIRRFLLHVLPKGFHRIRHYGLLASAARRANLARARELLAVPAASDPPSPRRRPTAPALPVLRRTHDHHRDLRALVPASGAATGTRLNRDESP